LSSQLYLVFDLGGAMRELWHFYYENTDAIVFVIDASQPSLFQAAQ
jgi:hypothetical protein